MFKFIVFLGIFSYSILFLGLISSLTKLIILLWTFFYGLILTFFYHRQIVKFFHRLKDEFKFLWLKPFSKILVILLIIQALINFIGALGPELAFDALWYHLTLPKLYLLDHKIYHLPGGLLYYSAMPRLIEMLYTAGLAISGSEVLPKLIHWSFGVGTALLTYQLGRLYYNRQTSLMAMVMFYSTLVVGWQSITAYIDLGRAFFEIMAFYLFLKWWPNEKIKYLFQSAVAMGLAMSSKYLALGSLALLLLLVLFKPAFSGTKKIKISIIYFLISVFVVLPWYFLAFINTGNPVYPIGGGVLDDFHKVNSLSISKFVSDFWQLNLYSSDPLNPLFLIFLPLIIVSLRKKSTRKKIGFLALICFLTYLIWYFTPRTGGGRFILPYLPLWSVLSVSVFLDEGFSPRILRLNKFLLMSIFLLHIFIRGFANYKYLAVILGKQTRNEFLLKNLNFSFGDFVDENEEIKKNVGGKKVLVSGAIHNLFYIAFPFEHQSWIEKGDNFDYYLAKEQEERPQNFRLIYRNKKTGVILYQRE